MRSVKAARLYAVQVGASPGGLSVLAPASSVRAGNVADVLRLLRTQGPLTRAQLVRAAGLAWPTVMTVVASLQEAGLVVEDGVQAGPGERGGRPGALLRFVPTVVTVLTARVPGGQLELAQVGADGTVLARWERVADAHDPAALLRAVLARARRIARTGVLGGVALSLPGFIDHRRGLVTFPAWGWDDVDVGAHLRERLKVPVTLLGPPAAAAVGEVAFRWPQELSETVLLFLGGGLSSAVITNGRLVRGSAGAVGELGHLFVNSGLVCRCGRTGCLETLTAGWALREQVSSLLGQPFDRATLADLEGLADPRVAEILDRAAVALGEALAWLLTMVNPSSVIVAKTSFADGSERFFERCSEVARLRAVGAAGEFSLLPGQPDAVLLGTIHAALEQLPIALRPPVLIAG